MFRFVCRLAVAYVAELVCERGVAGAPSRVSSLSIASLDVEKTRQVPTLSTVQLRPGYRIYSSACGPYSPA